MLNLKCNVCEPLQCKVIQIRMICALLNGCHNCTSTMHNVIFSSLKTDFVFSGALNVQCVIGSFVDRSMWMWWTTTVAAAAAAAVAVKHLQGFHSIHRKQFSVNRRLIVVQLQYMPAAHGLLLISILLTAIHFISIALIHSISCKYTLWIWCCVYADDPSKPNNLTLSIE